MAVGYPWNRRAKLTVDHTKLSGDLTDFPVALVWNGTNGNIPAEVYNASSTSPKSDGSDIRFTSDINGSTELAFEIVTFTPNSTVASANVEIYVELSSVSSSTDTVFYIWWGNPGASAYAVGDTYGRNAVWSNSFLAVYHMNEAAVVDATGNGNTLTNSGTSAGSTILGTARTFASGNYLTRASLYGSPATMSVFQLMICTAVGTYAGEAFSMGDHVNMRIRNNTTDGWRSSYAYTAAAWRDFLYAGFNPVGAGLFTGAFNIHPSATASEKLYQNGVARVTNTYTDAIYWTGLGSSTYWGIHGNGGGATFNFVGTIDECRISSVQRTDAWETAQHNSTYGFQTFITAGTVESAGGGIELGSNF